MNTSPKKDVESEIIDDHHDLREILQEAKLIYENQESIHCPFFEGSVALTSDGFNHLTHKPNRQPRNVNEQKLKLRLLKKALRIIRKAGTVQEYRNNMETFGESGRDGFKKMRQIEYWAFHDIVGGKKRFLVRVIIRRVGDGKLHFWSTMLHGKIDRQKLYEDGIDID